MRLGRLLLTLLPSPSPSLPPRWFYNDFDVHEWLLFLMQAQAAGHGRGVALGRIYRQDGTLVAVLAQEGMVRENLDKPRKDVSAKGKL